MSKEAEEYKNLGNDAYASGRHTHAIAYYTTAIELDPTNAALFSNRAAAYTKIEEFQKAKYDADMCIELRPEWPKVRKACSCSDLQLNGKLSSRRKTICCPCGVVCRQMLRGTAETANLFCVCLSRGTGERVQRKSRLRSTSKRWLRLKKDSSAVQPIKTVRRSFFLAARLSG
uniref:Uncharacterized protein n=1 Tax=Rhodosorus marinus TaxID=101924 RepID=A0A7S2ZXY0_9RHOD|mmetsp:Transcript_35440/g.140903  ORF Transcript_35440/g.140903 Transcript_35440/m.140903 type:complete len:173 (+) Transcript_35440:145-663(+)